MTPRLKSVPRRIRTMAALFLLLAVPAAAAETGTISGTVKGHTGVAAARAHVSLLDAQQTVLVTTRTDDQGRFSIGGVVAGSYMLRVESPGYPMRRLAVTVGREPLVLDVILDLPRFADSVTVTANPGRVEPVDSVSQPVNVIDLDEISTRAKAVVAQVANEEVGLHLQRTSPSLSGIFVRGLTGNKVSVFVDGQRYSTGAQRGGVNTFLDLMDPATLESVEVLRGPSSAQYGSDALGGSVQFLTRTPSLSAQGIELTGSDAAGYNSADNSYGARVTASVSGQKVALLGSISYRKVNDLRAGDGTDSHNAVRRFFEVDPSIVLDDGRLPDTDFSQRGALLKAVWAPSNRDRIVASFMRSEQNDGKRYDQLIGGDGNLIADLRDLVLEWGSVKYARSGLGTLDTLNVGYSYNKQREERVNQGGNGNPNATITHEFERTNVHGLQASVGKSWARNSVLAGGDIYLEKIDAPSIGVNPATGAESVRRGRVPDGARYDNGGLFVQDIFDVMPGRLSLVGNLRWSKASYESRASDGPLVGGQPLWPDDSQDFSSLTFRAGSVWKPNDRWNLSANVSRGFRAPHITDLGTVGLTGSGFEVSPAAISGLRGTVGSTADSSAVSTGQNAERLDAEKSLNYEVGIGFHTKRVQTELVGFINDIDGNIQKQALILPPGAVGTPLGDQIVTSQTPGGAVFVPASSNPVLINANFDDARIWGLEYTLDLSIGRSLSTRMILTYLHAEDDRTNLPPNIEGGTPAPDGWLHVRWAPPGRSWWFEPYAHGALRQDRLSSLDLSDRRTGASRSLSSISNFFNRGARVRGLIGNGTDNLPGTSDDVLKETGETLAQIQTRVLGSATSSSLYTYIPGYAVFGVRGGYRIAPGHELRLDVENIGDRNYRGISWGVDAPGRGVYVSYLGHF